MAFTKITNEDRAGKGNVGLPDTPLLTTTEMQEQMDSLPNLAIDKFNAFLDEIADPTAAQNIGCEAPLGIVSAAPTLLSVLTAIARVAEIGSVNSHTHENKRVLDSISNTFFDGLTNIYVMLEGITSVGAVVEDDATAIPTSKAVMNYVASVNIAQNILNALFPIGAVYQTTTTDPDTLFGTSGKWTLVTTDENGIKTYKRTA